MFRLFQKNRIMYSLMTEQECQEILDDVDEDYEEPIVLVQKMVRARDIELREYNDVDFPWHGYSEGDFQSFNSKLQEVLPIAMSCDNQKKVNAFIRKYQDIYLAYFERPIEVLFQPDSDKYGFLGDGRHRIWIAQQADSLLPVWICEYRKIKNMPIDEFVKCCALGPWRFY